MQNKLGSKKTNLEKTTRVSGQLKEIVKENKNEIETEWN